MAEFDRFKAARDVATAVYNFLVDLITVQRSVGTFDLFLSGNDQKAWLELMEAYCRQSGVETQLQ